MKLLKNVSQPVVALVLALLSVAASAQDFSRSTDSRDLSGHIDGDEDDQFPGAVRPIGRGGNPYCHLYNAYDCDYVAGCQFSRIYNQCVASTGPVRPIPRPQRGFVCVAEGSGYEEHRVSYQGVGRTQNEASRQALASCRNHDSYCYVTSCFAR